MNDIQKREEYINPKRDRKSELFRAILERARADGSLTEIEPIWDYYLPNDGEALSSERDSPLTNYEFNFVPIISFGGSEGIYVDLYLDGDCDGSGFKQTEIGVFKTLRTDLDACQLMGQLCGVLMYHGAAYVNKNLHRYTPKPELEAEYLRKQQKEQAASQGTEV
nr:hypothetical protein [uncultured Oscillibacter sp.]